MCTCFVLKNDWQSRKGGMARVRAPSPPVFECVGNDLTKPAGPADPGDAYESAKFGSSACGLMIAHAVWNYAGSKRTAQLMR